MRRWGRLLITMVVLPTVLVAGCATTPSCQAKAVDRTDGAMVRGWASGTFAFFTYAEVETVDGLPLSIWAQTGGGWPVDPGVRLLGVAGTYVGAFGGRDTGRVALEVTLRAGRSYQVKAERAGEAMTLWVEDEETREPVSERRSVRTTRWIKWL